ncbi:type VII secretion protein EssA [Niallia circulans]|jgi:type VII secretion protein EssA|uniref:Type VII secretion protein EssA n=2 Tax=Bacillaceae TaxID=186817 RepID=A0AA91Z0Y5_NIACI|nr:type VII secretion protein EssA [Niallia circulans]PAD82776.1 type VII secretion protein EssA [Niallia circulans]
MIREMNRYSKHIFLSLILIVIMAIFSWLTEQTARADSMIDRLQPNEYESGRNQKNTDFLKESSQSSKTDGLTAEKRAISFDGSKANDHDKWKGQLFTQKVETGSSITRKAEELQLFTDDEENVHYRVDSVGAENSTELSMALLIGILISICLLLLIFILFVFYRSNLKVMRKGNL